MKSSTLKRKLAQVVCLACVFLLSTKVVFTQEAERKVVKKVEPEYPSVLRDKGIGGTVRLRVTVKADGTVKETQVIGGNAVLVESASRAVKQWRYSPSDKESTIEVAIHFGQRP